METTGAVDNKLPESNETLPVLSERAVRIRFAILLGGSFLYSTIFCLLAPPEVLDFVTTFLMWSLIGPFFILSSIAVVVAEHRTNRRRLQASVSEASEETPVVFQDLETLIAEVDDYSNELARDAKRVIKAAKKTCAGSEGAQLTPELARVQEIEKKYLPETLTLYLNAAKAASTKAASETALSDAFESIALMREACDIPEAKYKEQSTARALETNRKFLEETFNKTPTDRQLKL